MQQYLAPYLPQATVQGLTTLADLSGIGGTADLAMQQHYGTSDQQPSTYEFPLAMADWLPAAGKGAAGLMKLGMAIPAWHGTPHAFKKFTMDKIGTGEGAQAYGHGLYFAGEKGTAKSYRDDLTGLGSYNGDTIQSDGSAVEKVARSMRYGKTPEDAISEVRQFVLDDISTGYDKAAFLRELDAVDPAKFSSAQGSLYKVNLSPDEHELLDWDKPLSEQSEAVRRKLAQHEVFAGRLDPDDDLITGAHIYAELSNRPGSNKEAASAALREAGIPGIKYKDQMSRGALGFGGSAKGYKIVLPDGTDIGGKATAGGDAFNLTQAETALGNLKNQYPDAIIEEVKGTSNYVIFDDSLIEMWDEAEHGSGLLGGVAPQGLMQSPKGSK